METKDCWQCESLRKQGISEEDIEKEHSDCHGWFHCGDECCGSCSVCGL
jgi:hypothetical protein